MSGNSLLELSSQKSSNQTKKRWDSRSDQPVEIIKDVMGQGENSFLGIWGNENSTYHCREENKENEKLKFLHLRLTDRRQQQKPQSPYPEEESNKGIPPRESATKRRKK